MSEQTTPEGTAPATTDVSGTRAGSHNYRAWVGPPARFDTLSAQQFALLTLGGLREHHTMLDIGCGSLRAGRLFLTYLQPGHYFGIEPEEWVLKEGIQEMLGEDYVARKQPTFSHDANFTLTEFGREFDFMLAQSIFSHTTLAQLHRCFDEASKVVLPTSRFFATFIPGDTDYEGDKWVYPGIVRFRTETMASIAAEHGFTMQVLEWPHPEQTWALFRPAGGDMRRLPPVLRANKARIARLESQVETLKTQLSASRTQSHRPAQRSIAARIENRLRREFSARRSPKS